MMHRRFGHRAPRNQGLARLASLFGFVMLTAATLPAAAEEPSVALSPVSDATEHAPAAESRLLRAGVWRRGEPTVPAVVFGVRAARMPGGSSGGELLGLFLFSRPTASSGFAGASVEPSLRIAPLRLTGGVWGLLAEGAF